MVDKILNYQTVKSAFLKAIDAGKPEKILSNKIKKLIPKNKNLKILALGKAASSMAETIIKLQIGFEGIIITNDENFREVNGFKCFAAGHPIPDVRGLEATRNVELMLEKLGENNHLLLLLSGGGSSLMPAPCEGITLKQKIFLNERLLESGVDINQVNAVRRLFSRLKGGRLAERAYPAGITQIIFSDVMEDNLETIASGIAAPDPIQLNNVYKILKKTNLIQESFVSKHIEKIRNSPGILPLKKENKIFYNVKNYIAANNDTCVNQAIKTLEKKLSFINSSSLKLEGEASKMASKLAKWFIKNAQKGRCFTVIGGETTVTLNLSNSGKGGRSQELALSYALYMKQHFNQKREWIILSAGTDGRDGPTDAAGAMISSHHKLDINQAKKSLKNHDSYNFLLKNNMLVKTGGTNTNLGDIVILTMEQALNSI